VLQDALFYFMKMLKQSMLAPAFVLACAFTAIPGNDSKSGLDLAAMNKSVSPGEDFYEYANGTWVRNTPVPSAEVAWGSPNILNDENNKKIKVLVEEVASDKAATKGSTRQQLRDYYLTAMDTVQLEKQDYAPLRPYLDKVEKISSKEELIVTSAKLQRSGMRSMYRLYVTRDLKNSNRNIVYISQSGLSLPDRDYYLKADERFVKIRSAYTDHITKMLSMIGRKNAAADAQMILKMETEMAKASMSRVDQRDQTKTYNSYSLKRLQLAAPAINWGAHFAAINCPSNAPLVINQPDYLIRLSALVDSIPLQDWKTYLTWKLLNSAADKYSVASRR
jgi:putative endopeptidase